MKALKFTIAAFLLCLGIVGPQQLWAGRTNPSIVTTISPLYSLVKELTDGVADVKMLIPSNASPHTFQLHPSVIKTLRDADLVVWIGPMMETTLAQWMKNQQDQSKILTALEIPGLTLHSQRRNCCEGHSHHHSHHSLDPHVWLNVNNAKVIIMAVQRLLLEKFPAMAATLTTNSERLFQRLDGLNQDLAHRFEGLGSIPFAVFHDGYQYFEKLYKLSKPVVLYLSLGHYSLLSVKKRQALLETLRRKKVQCIFTERQFPKDLSKRLAKEVGVEVIEIDPLGDSSTSYVAMMRELSQTLHRGLQAKRQ